MKKFALSLIILPLLVACSTSGNTPEPTQDGYFKQFEEKVDNKRDEYTFINLFDGEYNRFTVTFNYDLHFGYTLKIVEYDLIDWLYYPNEGTFAKDYESVSFYLADKSTSELFPRGQYTLKHSLVNDKDSFTLVVIDKEYKLTTEEKSAPVHIDGDLVGNFVYLDNEEEKFSISSTVSSKEDGLKSTITLKEGELDFVAANISFSSASCSFILSGANDGHYLKRGVSYTFKFIESTGKWKLNDYVLEKKDGEKPTKDGYFYNSLVTFGNEHVLISILSEMGESSRFVSLSELDEGGKKNINTFFDITNDGESLVNSQSIKGNLIFTEGSNFEIKHTIKNNVDTFELYKNNTLLYSDMLIQQ